LATFFSSASAFSADAVIAAKEDLRSDMIAATIAVTLTAGGMAGSEWGEEGK
jgi:hypothetical protein